MDEKKKAEPSIPAQIESVVRGAVTDFYLAPTAAPDAAAGQSEAAHDPRCAKLGGGGYICVTGCPAFRMGEVPKREGPPNVKSSLHPPVLTELSREEGAAKFGEVESADSNASLPDWPVKDSLTARKENLNPDGVPGHEFDPESPSQDCSCGWKATDEAERITVGKARSAWLAHVATLRVTPLPAATFLVSNPGTPKMSITDGVREIAASGLVLRALRNLRPRVACPRWAAVSDGFGLGSTYSQELCRNFGLDPNEQIGPARADEPDENETPTPSISFGEGKKIYDQGWNDGLDALRKVFLALAARAGRN